MLSSAGANPFHDLRVGGALFALAGHLLIDDAPVVIGLGEINGDLFLLRHAVAEHRAAILDHAHALIDDGREAGGVENEVHALGIELANLDPAGRFPWS